MRLPAAIPITNFPKSSFVKINCAACLAISVPFSPIATPMCAAFNAGPSFTPSPNIATTSPSSFKAFTTANFASGNIRANKTFSSAAFNNSFSESCVISLPVILSSA